MAVSERLENARKSGEAVEAMIRQVGTRKLPVYDEESKRVVTKEVECAIFELEDGVKGICPAPEFSDYEHKSLVRFVGTVHEVIVLKVDQEEKVAVVSVRMVNQLKRANFWRTIEALESEGTLHEKTFEGTITGYKEENRTIFVNVEGQDCYMKHYDWDHNRRNVAEAATPNKKIEVKVLRFDKENQIVQVSRKATIPDPMEQLKQFKNDEAVVGAVTAVHPIHGIFVQVIPGFQIKATKPRHLEAPIVGDIVNLRILQIDEEKRQAKSVILGYPQGKKKVKDLGDFLYE
ncbi:MULTISPECIES: RNA-binding protein [Pseudobacillus]|uniref:RNA-binding protein n=1 Tax=Pseudobacillus TaxID=108525 RepID=UPI003878FC6A